MPTNEAVFAKEVNEALDRFNSEAGGEWAFADTQLAFIVADTEAPRAAKIAAQLVLGAREAARFMAIFNAPPQGAAAPPTQ